MTRPLKEYIEDGTLQDLAKKGIVPLTTLTHIYIWERVQTIIDENPTAPKEDAIKKVADECRYDESWVRKKHKFWAEQLLG